MKKIIFTFAAIALFLTANAQDKRVETWPNGNKKSEGIVIGKSVDPTASKEVQARQSVNIIKDGKWTNWFENGNVRSEENYDKGITVGIWKVWYDNGQLESEINFTTGKAAHFYKNGNKHSEGGIAAGMLSTGKWTGYHENGNKNYEGSYTADGQKTGVWTWYDETGKVTGTQTYKDGELIK
jgi:antitoxin component YwqK of YwqJK toxin-antitoxin module